MTARITRLLAAVLVAALVSALVSAVLLASAGPASAHATLVSSSPAQGARLDALPAEVRFEFTEEIAAPAYVIVTAPDGSSVADGDPVVDGRVVTQAVADGPEGGYTMAYRAVSRDGHPVTGAISFSVGDAGPAAPPGAAATIAPDDAPEAAEPTAAGAGSGDDSVSRRQVVAVSVGAGLFGAALLLMLLARRAGR